MLSDEGKFLVQYGIDEKVVTAAETMGVKIALLTYSIKFMHDAEVLAKVTSGAGSYKKHPHLVKTDEDKIVSALKTAAEMVMNAADGELQGQAKVDPKVNPPFQAAKKQTGPKTSAMY